MYVCMYICISSYGGCDLPEMTMNLSMIFDDKLTTMEKRLKSS